MRYVILGLLVLVQASLGDLLRIWGSAPDLMLVGILWAAAPGSAALGALSGFLAGLALDLLGTDPLGACALAGTSAGFFAARHLSPELKLHPLRLSARALLIVAPIEIFLANLRFLGLDVSPLELLLTRALPAALYTLAICTVLLFIPRSPAGMGREK